MASSGYDEPRSTSDRFLPPEPRIEPPYRLTPGLALRVAVIAAIVVGAFAVLFVRLWSLQVLSGDRYLEQAQSNQLRLVRLEAPRGAILDRNGRVLVDNVAGTAVKLWVGDMPARNRYRIVDRLARVLSLSPRELARAVDERLRTDPLTPITVKAAVHPEQIAYLAEHARSFPGVRVQDTYLRSYPYQSLLSHVLGFVREISPPDLARRRSDPKYAAGDQIGQTGIERSFDGWLRGTPGLAQIRVDSLGTSQGPVEPRRDPVPGLAVRLTIDIKLQRAAERALSEGIRLAIENESYQANGGAIVALRPADGAVLAMASNPTYKPALWVGRPDMKKLAPLLDAETAERRNFPGINRAIQVAYPPGSTWKLVTALAALEERKVSPYELVPCPPFAVYGLDKHKFINWDPYVNHAMQLEEAIARSCDTYFYDIGNRFYLDGDQGRNRMQEWARKFGFGAPTGIGRDLVGESRNTLVPTPAWRKRHYPEPVDKAWNPGDSIQLAIGQKDVTVTPLQMARFYAMIANGGKLVTPYLVEHVETRRANGEPALVTTRFGPAPPVDVGVDPAYLQLLRDALYKATHLDIGTSSSTFADYKIGIAGKTGTAEKVVAVPGYPPGHKEDQSWWCGYGPAGLDDTPSIVVCAVIENGGHGGTAAAPAALRVFEHYFGVKGAPRKAVKTD